MFDELKLRLQELASLSSSASRATGGVPGPSANLHYGKRRMAGRVIRPRKVFPGAGIKHDSSIELIALLSESLRKLDDLICAENKLLKGPDRLRFRL